MAEAWAERTMNRVVNAVPGYAGYRDKESRRDADRMVRDRLAAAFDRHAARVERVATALAEQRRLGDVGPVNDFASAIRHLSDRIRTASYGYGGLFGSRDINAAVIDQMRLFDESLFAGVEQLDRPVAALESSSNGDIAAAAATGTSAVRDLLDRFDQRSQVAEAAVPAPPDQVNKALAVLQTPEERAAAEQPPAAYDLHDRDALAILGDNFVVDARINVETAAAFFRLFRIASAPDRWLYVPRRPGEALASFVTSSEPFLAGESPTIGGEAFTTELSGHGSGDIVGVGGETQRTQVSFSLLRGTTNPETRALVLQWGEERQVLVGRTVHPDDVEIFGKPS